MAVPMTFVSHIAVSLVPAAAGTLRTVVVPSRVLVPMAAPVFRLPVGRHLYLAAGLSRWTAPVCTGGRVWTDVPVVRCAQPGSAGVENRCHLLDRRHLHPHARLRHVLPQPVQCRT
ncbi:hypothetical protein [Streptomyces sp. NPDC017230]|uniref:hypothetical protein n=1 Tax=unclassified Streptomyces TaxID=2593676 RepID=UPI00379F2042